MDPNQLIVSGPIADVLITAPSSHGRRQRTGKFLVDTGTEYSIITIAAAQKLGLRAARPQQLRFGRGPAEMRLIYPVEISLAKAPSIRVEVSAFAVPDFESTRYNGLIGRDFLRKALFIYNGVTGSVSIELFRE